MKSKNKSLEFFPFIFLWMYIIIGFIPDFNALDAKNTNLLYLSILNTIVIGFFYIKQLDFLDKKLPIGAKFYLCSFIGLFFWALCSSIWAINSNEALVSSLQLVTKISTIFCVFISLKAISKKQRNWLFKVFLIVLFIENISVIHYFLENNHLPRSSKLIQKLSHNYSNINILSAGLVLKACFAFFFILQGRDKIWRFLAFFTIGITFSSTLLISARTGFYNLIIISCCFLAYLLFYKREKKFLISGGVLLGLIGFTIFFTLNLNKVHPYKLNNIAQMFSPNFRVKKSNNLQHEKNNDSQKKIFTQLSGRESYWGNALATFKNSPLLGVGIGNWKLSSKDDMIVRSRNISFLPYRVHNDFLEILAELGIFGFFILLSIFILLFYVIFKLILSKESSNKRDEFFCLLLGLMVYFSDSFFNFPLERPAVFIIFIFISGFILLDTSKKTEKKETNFGRKISFFLLLPISLIIMFFNWKMFSLSVFENNLHHLVKNKSYEDLVKIKAYNYEELIDKLNSYPAQLGADGQSLESYKAIFARVEKKYEKAIKHYKVAALQMPSSKVSVKGIVDVYYHHLKKNDSALFYSKEQFKNFPFHRENYLILKSIYKKNKDTVAVMKILNRFLKYSPNEVKTWMSKAYNQHFYFNDKKRVAQIMDSAIAINPKSKSKLQAYKQSLLSK